MDRKERTRLNILNAGLELFSEKGYKAVTTKEIAEAARVNEVTVFRHFGNKKAVLEGVFEEFVFKVVIEEVFGKALDYNLEKDLTYIAKKYSEYMEKNKKILMIAFKNLPEYMEADLIKFPRRFKEVLITYFLKMQQLGKVKDENPELLALNFILFCFGLFSGHLLSEGRLTNLGKDECIEFMIPLFVEGYKK
ncbi:MAG: TetR/AcrR family transcriptional regulator [Anaerotignum sp.]|nr:TetR/AcrR family transcriptional regulator [Anaerotignum sp.]